MILISKTISTLSYNYIIFLGIASFLGISIILLFNHLFGLNNKNIFQNIKSKILVFILLINAFIFACFSLNNITSYINYIYLNNMDKFYIMVSFIAIVFYLIKNDHLAFFRCSTLLFYFYVLVEIITCVLLVFYADLNNLLPITMNLETSINYSYIYIIFLISPILFLLFLSKNMIKDNQHFGKKMFITYLIVTAIIILKNVLCVSVLGYSSIGIYNYPDVIMYKNINLFGFLERIEWLLCFNSITNFFFLISLSLFYIKEGLNYIKPLKKNISYLYPLIICIIAFLVSYFIPINYLYVIYSFVIFIFLHLIFCLFSFLK